MHAVCQCRKQQGSVCASPNETTRGDTAAPAVEYQQAPWKALPLPRPRLVHADVHVAEIEVPIDISKLAKTDGADEEERMCHRKFVYSLTINEKCIATVAYMEETPYL
jgi:hypothetical protein